jgi:transcriptional activator of cad operon
MQPTTSTPLRIGDWRVDPASGQISRNGSSATVETRTLRLLLFLADHPGETVSIEDLLNHVWPDVTVSQDSVYQAVASLRRLLGDDPKQPAYITTVPRLGYRMVAAVSPWVDDSATHKSSAGFSKRHGWMIAFALCIALPLGVLVLIRTLHPKFLSPTPQISVGVLPFLDLTEGMHEEEFADGMTEELIDRLSKIPSLRVPGPTSSFYFKGKQIELADIAKSLGVAYLLDGSVRKSGGQLRVAARLVRADTGFVVWSESYDRPAGDVLMIQDDIAGEVSKALKTSLSPTLRQ